MNARTQPTVKELPKMSETMLRTSPGDSSARNRADVRKPSLSIGAPSSRAPSLFASSSLVGLLLVTACSGSASSYTSTSEALDPVVETPAWTARLGGSSTDQINAVAMDSSGAVIAAGFATGNVDAQANAGGQDALLAKYSPTGVKVWTRLLGTTAADAAQGVAVSATDDIYVTGYMKAAVDSQAFAGVQDVWLSKYDGSGTKQWTRLLGTTAADSANAVSVSAAGVFVAGTTASSLPGGVRAAKNDVLVAKYDTAGTKVWATSFGSTEDDTANGIAADATGNSYLVGTTGASLGGNTALGGKDIFLAKYDNSGNRLWVKQVGTAADDSGTGVAIGPDGDVYVSGITLGTMGTGNAGGADAVLIHFDNNGNVVWTQQLGSANLDEGLGVAADSSSVYLTGRTLGRLPGANAPGILNIFAARYGLGGNVITVREYAGAANATGVSTGAAVAAANGRLVVAGFVSSSFDGLGSLGGVDGILLSVCSNHNFSCELAGGCSTSNGGCAATQACTPDTAGFVQCGCSSGYTGSMVCSDVNECLVTNGGCDALTTCTNTVGSRTCGSCPSGYSGSGATGCADVNECATNNGGCDPNAACVNTAGSFSCGACNAGFTGTSATGCVDVNECATNNGGCDPYETCTNTPGSRTCSCPSGFTVGGHCAPDLCATGNGGCDSNASCAMTSGTTRTCTCNVQFFGDGIQCVYDPGSVVTTVSQLETSVQGQASSIATLQDTVSSQATTIQQQADAITALQQAVAALQSAVAAKAASSDLAVVQAKTQHLTDTTDSSGHPAVVFSGVNVYVNNGAGATDATVNGTGNLVVGYDEGGYTRQFCNSDADCANLGSTCWTQGNVCRSSRQGSHNVIVGPQHSYASFGSVIAGLNNSVTGQYASITGGRANTAMGFASAITGGTINRTTAEYATVSGGAVNRASGQSSSVCGGNSNVATGAQASVSGGQGLTASADYSSRSGDSTFVSATDAASTYLTQTNAASTYLSQTNAASTYATQTALDTTDSVVASTQTTLSALTNVMSTTTDENGQPAVVFSGVNVYVNSGAGTTDAAPNGLGNLIVGYDERGERSCGYDMDCPSGSCDTGTGTCNPLDQTGSHNLVVGKWHSYRSYGGLVAGENNVASAPAAFVSGRRNTASGYYSAVNGGYENAASGDRASVSGGSGNIASGDFASVSGGYGNTASELFSWVGAGYGNAASNRYASVAGGEYNGTLDDYASVSGDSSLLPKVDAASTYLAQADAAVAYLTQADATSIYLTQADADSTYLTQPDARNTYLTQTDAATTYATTASLSAYETSEHAAGTYLRQEDAASTYATQAALGTTNSNVASTQTSLTSLTNVMSTTTDESGYPAVVFSGVNVYVNSGAGMTDATPNGLGNLIVGYNEPGEVTPINCTQDSDCDALSTTCDTINGVCRGYFCSSDADCAPINSTCDWRGYCLAPRAGSHNLVVGNQNGYASYGGLIAGSENNVYGAFASVTGGLTNIAAGRHAHVSGGEYNNATGENTSVSGGNGNTATGVDAAVSGGNGNLASGECAAVCGGGNNIASAFTASVSGGKFNSASELSASVSGGENNVASGLYSAVSGGSGVTVSSEDGNSMPDLSGYLTTATAASTYLTSAGAASTYLTSSGAASTYLTQSSAASTYLTSSGAASTYLTSSGAASTYLTSSGAASTYLTSSALSSAFHMTTATDADGHPSVVFSGVNVYVNSGAGATDASVNGTGNLVVGYEERGDSRVPCQADSDCAALQTTCNVEFNVCRSYRTGSHNLIVGSRHSYSSYGGFLAGESNSLSGPFASAFGGFGNIASGPSSSVTGAHNTASGDRSSVTGGSNNRATATFSSVSGGRSNEASAWYSTVAGGKANTASGENSAICGGENAEASGWGAAALGGNGNIASGEDSVVSGGTGVTVSSFYGTSEPDLSGYLTTASAASTYLTQSGAASTYLTSSGAASTYLTSSGAASTYLTSSGAASTYLTSSGAASTYLTQSSAASTYLTSTGLHNTYHLTAFTDDDGYPAVVFSGVNVYVNNGAGGTDATPNGKGNLIIGYNEGAYSPISCTQDSDCAVLGTDCNTAQDVCFAGHAGSHNLVLGMNNSYASFGGLVAGEVNAVTGPFSSVTGGSGNWASGSGSAVSGGESNTASGPSSSVSGGWGNTALGGYSSVSGGGENLASGAYSSVTGGGGNRASNSASSVSGGENNLASGSGSSVHGGNGITRSTTNGYGP
jgi:uncharacterized coiled-coil protein SlyX